MIVGTGAGRTRFFRLETWKDERRDRDSMIKVRPRPNEPIQQLMRRLKKLCEREGVLREMKRTAYYEKPSDRNRRNMRKAKRRMQKMSLPGGEERVGTRPHV
jgi:small subunit ribosomal protein S21